ncbi:polymer-forming cytoskeletal protein [Halobacteria archaeon AArc-m2/3/4]|uniref:Polymer-forming cytoskeletal protein n=1 Tax=Natronoglomus mannanivorans TaxID=2979990 RepID=A0AAP3E4U4_9EURY|nr:polymer-forming cytoskeletal protein [Halobacteria archaeon AArc-xg1-1]MCU4975708.1 polymer-forming cytoskeletal protein [Halobacteria archaeon AArc-m2/3/4]
MKEAPTRRRLLQLSGGVLTVGLAGCLGSMQSYNPFDAETDIDESSPIENRDRATTVERSSTEIRADGDVIVPTAFDLSGNIVAEGSVLVERDADVDGSIDAGEHVLLERDAEVDDDVRAGGRVVLREDAEVEGSIDAGDAVFVQHDTEVDGNVVAGGDVVLEGDATVDGDVTGATVDVAVTAGVRGSITETGSED